MTAEAEPEVHIHRCFTCTDLYTCRCSRNVRELLCIPCMEYARQDGKNRVMLIVRPKLDETIAYAAGRESDASKKNDMQGATYWFGYRKALEELKLGEKEHKP